MSKEYLGNVVSKMGTTFKVFWDDQKTEGKRLVWIANTKNPLGEVFDNLGNASADTKEGAMSIAQELADEGTFEH